MIRYFFFILNKREKSGVGTEIVVVDPRLHMKTRCPLDLLKAFDNHETLYIHTLAQSQIIIFISLKFHQNTSHSKEFREFERVLSLRKN